MGPTSYLHLDLQCLVPTWRVPTGGLRTTAAVLVPGATGSLAGFPKTQIAPWH